MKQKQLWILVSITGLLLVALLGLVMRYKIAFEFPFFNQKNLQHAHSHFAFTGWVSQTLYLLIGLALKKMAPEISLHKYRVLLGVHITIALGMLISFVWGGYNVVSIVFSTLSLLVSYVFTYFFFRDVARYRIHHPSVKWFKCGMLFNILSSAGTLALAYMMATKNIHQKEYLSSVYFYLHFQYNGWFFFACMGLFVHQTHVFFEKISPDYDRWFFRLFLASCVPAFFLSTLWLTLPLWLYVIVVLAAITQCVAWFIVLHNIRKIKPELRRSVSPFAQFVFALVGICISAKMLLQLGSTIPEVSHLAFGYRHIVIAYLHLILLAIVSVFLVAYVFFNVLHEKSILFKTGMWLFIAGVYLNEVVLGVQGIASFSYTNIPYANELLLGITVLILTGLLLLWLCVWRHKPLVSVS